MEAMASSTSIAHPLPFLSSVNSVFVFCTFSGENLVHKIESSHFSIQRLKNVVEGQWGKLVESVYYMHYSVQDFPNCVLATDVDLSNMISLAMLHRLTHVNIHISIAATQESSSVVSATSNNGSFSVGVREKECSEDDMLHLFGPSTGKVLLTDGWDKAISCVDQLFQDGAPDFRNALRKMAVGVGFDYAYLRNDHNKVSAVCSNKGVKGCSWSVCGAIERSNGYFYVKTLNNVHSCGACYRSLTHKRVCSDLVCSLIVEEVRKSPQIRPISIQKAFLHQYGLQITYTIAFDALEKARTLIHGDEKDSFQVLSSHLKAISDSNPGSHLVLDFNEVSMKFRKVFISLKSCIDGFNYCRPLLFLDGTFLKGKFKGHLLVATSKDGDRGLYPLAFAVVDSENFANWKWFLDNLKMILSPSRIVTFVSDRNLGLLEAMNRVFPGSPHGYCINHLKMNLKDKFKGRRSSKALRNRMLWLFSTCAYATTVEVYQTAMETLLNEGGQAAQAFFENMEPKHWANAFFSGNRYGEMSSNAAESFNNWILDARYLPITPLVNQIRLKMMKSFRDRSASCQLWKSVFCPSVEKTLSKHINEGRTWVVVGSSESVYEVQCLPSVVVNLENHTCTCCQWQITGIPCSHAVACILSSKKSLHLFVDRFYHASTYAMSYADPLGPVSMFDQPRNALGDAPIEPPTTKRPPGRPKKKRIMSRGEYIPRMMKCGRCGRVGNHNKKSCTEPIQ